METGTWARRRRKAAVVESAPVSRREVRQQLSLASGGSGWGNKDPVSNVTENFKQTFDSIGQRRARALSGDNDNLAESGLEDASKASRAGTTARNISPEQDRLPVRREGEQAGEARRGAVGGQVMPESGIPLEKFSETAFRRGKLSASVLGGTGKMMLVSCLKRTGERSDGDFQGEDTLFQSGSQTRNVPGHGPDKMLFSRGFVNSAVGLVVDTLQDARQTVDAMRQMALGTGDLRGSVEGSALLKLYPFLDNSREKAMVERYEERLRLVTDAEERAVLQNGLVHARAMLDRKASMKEEFINQLRQISDKAIQALEEFEAPGFAEEVWQEVTGQTEEPIPPEDGEAPPEDGENPPDGGGNPPADKAGSPDDGGENPPEEEEPAPEDGGNSPENPSQ